MGMNLLRFSIVFFILFPFEVYSYEENSASCDCNILYVTEQEERDDCSGDVKKETCPEYYQILQMRNLIEQQEEARRLRDRMEPRITLPNRR